MFLSKCGDKDKDLWDVQVFRIFSEHQYFKAYFQNSVELSEEFWADNDMSEKLYLTSWKLSTVLLHGNGRFP